jgi:hypothetical protein
MKYEGSLSPLVFIRAMLSSPYPETLFCYRSFVILSFHLSRSIEYDLFVPRNVNTNLNEVINQSLVKMMSMLLMMYDISLHKTCLSK